MPRAVRTLLLAATALACGAVGVVPAPAGAQLPPAAGSGPRPGPAILYAPPVVAPQLTNAGIWRA
ncbi:MAG: hypothetical protein AVDCRST_MAG54-847, partial [uncultured Actinomycetospora sp.]